MTIKELIAQLEKALSENEWAHESNVKLDVAGLIVSIGSVEFDKDGDFYILAVSR